MDKPSAGKAKMGSIYEDEDQISAVLHALSDYFEVKQKLNTIKEFTFSHPVVTVFSVVLLTLCSIPIICFVTFVCGSMFLGVTGFVLIEGTMLTLATLFLGGALLLVGLCAVGFSSVLVAGFFLYELSIQLMNDLSKRLKAKEKLQRKE
ncbi:hypothetical protein LOTGIDRAFT_235994 [Lottia gigantea]|uniref:Promethin n=1 Tax=Lottia gigantea TaxID=225164 RepID=V3ZKZ3_LOTGI|nr:hypothetical protein LOTGIDRAFT_235994 [Lottia gigantea]ESO84942.1 hypothetical protein LOTGIDRAFT_235994 [Lottia gigantea]